MCPGTPNADVALFMQFSRFCQTATWYTQPGSLRSLSNETEIRMTNTSIHLDDPKEWCMHPCIPSVNRAPHSANQPALGCGCIAYTCIPTNSCLFKRRENVVIFVHTQARNRVTTTTSLSSSSSSSSCFSDTTATRSHGCAPVRCWCISTRRARERVTSEISQVHIALYVR